MKTVKQWFARETTVQRPPVSRVSAAPLFLALEPRLVYDASVAVVGTNTHAIEQLASVTHVPAAVQAVATGSTASTGASESATARAAVVQDIDVNAPTLATTSTGDVSFVAGNNTASTPVVVNSNVTVSEASGNVVTSAEVAITGNVQTGEDVLAFTNNGTSMGNITGSYAPQTGILSLSSVDGSATSLEWDSALESVTYTDSAVTPNTAARTIEISVDAGTAPSNVLSRTIDVTDTDQAPVISGSGLVDFISGDNKASQPVLVASSITISDADNTTLSSAIVDIAVGFVPGQDVLTFNNVGGMGNIVGNFNPSSGVMLLTSLGATATVGQWDAALRSVTFTDTAVVPSTATRTIDITVNDGTDRSNGVIRNVFVFDVDQTPLLSTTSTGTASFVAGDNVASTPTVIDSGIAVSDRDNATLATAAVRISAGFQSGEDVLAFTNDGSSMGNIIGSYNPTTGLLVLTSQGASATLGQWKAALDSVTYTDTAVTPNTATRTIAFTVSDGSEMSAPLMRNVTVADTHQTLLVSDATTSLTYTADGKASDAIIVGAGLTLTDRNPTLPTSETVSFVGTFNAKTDVLTFKANASTGDITATYNATLGVLTLQSTSGTATLGQWTAAFAAVSYQDTAVEHSNSTRTIAFKLYDSAGASAPATVTLAVNAVAQSICAPSGSQPGCGGGASLGGCAPIGGDAWLQDLSFLSSNLSLAKGFLSGSPTLTGKASLSTQFANALAILHV